MFTELRSLILVRWGFVRDNPTSFCRFQRLFRKHFFLGSCKVEWEKENKTIKRWRSSNLAQRVKTLAAKPNDPSLPTGPPWREERTEFRKLPSALRVPWHLQVSTRMHPHAHTNNYNNLRISKMKGGRQTAMCSGSLRWARLCRKHHSGIITPVSMVTLYIRWDLNLEIATLKAIKLLSLRSFPSPKVTLLCCLLLHLL